MLGRWETEEMAVTETNQIVKPIRPRRTHWARVVFYVVLFAWNAYFVGAMGYTVWMRHHPHVETGQNNVVLSLEVYSLILGNLRILGTSLLVRRLSRRQQTSTLA